MPSTARASCSWLAGVADHDVRLAGDTGGGELAPRRVDHRTEVPEVRRGGHDLGGDDEATLVAGGLGVVALNPPAHPMHELGVRVGDVHIARRNRRRPAGARRTAEAPAVLHPPTLGHGESAKPRERATFVGPPLGGGVTMQLAYRFPGARGRR
jgi:hypothetical protein